ncbi:bifunctional phosphopantothenoylcysteine decarboxylase/phosphopantothenate--cysteine ligase CoaBC [Candidatus Marithrix sp. Canyon 246]|uniref:bifunctional phosphopantothenoylcysteine decarboxylase/phosphopantothenate--cysteine ligase CoaBC n=2 Tax=Candidatus Marithrix sp. Canyon 246 TaxID=1827136 RepID=UPI00084A1C52|nr:bifunctional phosphopantothenoylcysteine decarboxylase/phosphopantothenate--cysteine ligase CoaBC [Candidatus Marithrix sp. Canyon 246]
MIKSDSLLKNKQILLGITGGIAAYKSADLVRRLIEQQAQVQVVMTEMATKFITPLTLEALSGKSVYVVQDAMAHIELARWADMVLIAPATANFLANLTYGHAHDLLSTLCLATAAPICVAPAMNQQMWHAAITQENCQKLQQRGITIFGPAIGSQACGDVGAGRMLEVVDLIDSLQLFFHKTTQKVLITAGPTREHIDPVRFISNRSSGKMGYAIAEAASAAGYEVTLISGPVCLSSSTATISVNSAQDMYEAVMAQIKNTDIFISTAAVADYRPVKQAEQKLKKTAVTLQLNLEPTPDILASVSNLENPPFTVGFAAETNNLVEYAKKKLVAKKLDMIAANQVGIEGLGFDSEDNALSLFWQDGGLELARANKKILAKQLIDVIIERFNS